MICLSVLAACAGPNGAVNGGMSGSSGSASARSDIFKIPFP